MIRIVQDQRYINAIGETTRDKTEKTLQISPFFSFSMGFSKSIVAWAVMVVAIALLRLSDAAVYTVGDGGGWTSIGNLDYKQWAAIKTFQVGDIIRFEYNAQFHNVLRVTHSMYKSCNASVPLATYTTGNDTINITSKGHHFFICGVPGHCQSGQKVDINVLRESEAAPSPSGMTPASASATVPSTDGPAPLPGGAISLKTSASMGSITKLCLAMAAYAVFVLVFH